jgi:hypothetical protein
MAGSAMSRRDRRGLSTMVDKRARRSKAEILKLRRELIEIVDEHRPLTIRHLFYLARGIIRYLTDARVFITIWASMATLSPEAVAAVILGVLSFFAGVLRVISFGWRLVSLFAFMMVVADSCLRSSWMRHHFRQPLWRILISTTALLSIGLLLWTPMRTQYMQEHLSPSFVFVFGGPLGDNHSAIWAMFPRHFGPQPALGPNEIEFWDTDRQQILRDWAISHRPAIPPKELAATAEKAIVLPTVGPTLDFGEFNWQPLNPNRQYYRIGINSPEGNVFTEDWRVARIKGELRTQIIITREQPKPKQTIFECTDPDFSSPISSDSSNAQVTAGMPPSIGWRPNLKTPVVIFPYVNHFFWGLSATDSPCWHVATHHLGDAILPLALPTNVDDAAMTRAIAIFAFLILWPLYSMLACWWMGVSSLWLSSDNEKC